MYNKDKIKLTLVVEDDIHVEYIDGTTKMPSLKSYLARSYKLNCDEYDIIYNNIKIPKYFERQIDEIIENDYSPIFIFKKIRMYYLKISQGNLQKNKRIKNKRKKQRIHFKGNSSKFPI